ncbi:MAG: ribosome maturation factor RimM [Dysgonamonadaceae bacterium]|nr:ribosome maturation factor RimM [Dysgonamonadaceae bacterium]MDD4728631.1 ribosome maturation factor RimM [Dysgonamonadaceae bacterium]
MIRESDLVKIGKILKPHGVKGEMTIVFDKSGYADIDTDFYFFLLDGMYVPFYIEEFRFNSDSSARVKFEGVNFLEKASTYNDTSLFISKEFIQNEDVEVTFTFEWEQFIGYTILDERSSFIGKIEEVDSSTINVLFIVEKNNEEFLIPATSDFIIKVDSDNMKLHMTLPDGLLDQGI